MLRGFDLCQVVLMDLGLAGSGDRNEQLGTLYGRLETFCKQNKLSLHMNAFTRQLLHYPNEAEFPCGMLGGCSSKN